MRADQIIGLNEKADKYIIKWVEYIDSISRRYFDGTTEEFAERGKKNDVKFQETSEVYGGFDDYPLLRYITPEGKVYTEFVQAEPWSSGAVIFLALKDSEGNVIKDTLWTDEEINEYL